MWFKLTVYEYRRNLWELHILSMSEVQILCYNKSETLNWPYINYS